MAVQVKINGKGPYRLIFDTGAPTNLINNKLAKEAGVIDQEGRQGPRLPLFGMASGEDDRDARSRRREAGEGAGRW